MRLSVEAGCALITAGGVVIAAFVSWLVARSTSSYELKKLKMEWAREDMVSSEDEFARMVSATAAHVSSDSYTVKHAALREIAFVRAKESGDLGAALDRMYASIKGKDSEETDRLLTAVIEQKRQAKGNSKKP